MKKTKTMDKVKEAELKLRSDEAEGIQEAREKYRKQTAEINAEISELKEDQQEIKKTSI